MLRIDSESDITELTTASLMDHDFREDDLREWIIGNTQSILGEELLLIGREVSVRNIGDGIDLLGIDRDGNVVVIELKRGSLSGTVDFQAMKYAAYTSHWDYEKLRDQFDKFCQTSWGQSLYEPETTFTEALDEFCNEDYTLNQDQRIVLVGETVRDRLNIVLRWLSDRDIDVTVVEYQLFSDGDQLFLDTEQTIPTPEHTVTDVSPDTSEEPWKENGRNWHLEERSNKATANHLENVVGAIEDIDFLDGPDWSQKHYLSFKRERKIRIAIRTKRTLFHIDVYDIPVEEIEPTAIATALGIPEDDVAAKESLRGGRPGLRITCRPNHDMDLKRLTEQVRDALTAHESA